ncbi:MAG: hypothetical protein ACTSQ8_19000 [Candidatus Helarchaeota archaeon]
MNEEVYETNIGLFKILEHPENEQLVFVQTCIPTNEAQIWEDMGCMKKKEFFKMINEYNPKKYRII